MNPPLIPFPKSIEIGRQRIHLGRNSPVSIGSTDSRLTSAWERLAFSLLSSAAPARVTIRESSSSVGHPQGYRLLIRKHGVELTAASAAGCFVGLQTLGQLIDSEGGVPLGEIADDPDFTTRGLLHDVSRGKVPKLPTLKRLVDRLARLKINQLQLYIEHTFVFSFDPEICGPHEGLTADEVRELDRYCRDRFIELVPAVATLGHMGRVLSMPRYREMAEVEAATAWTQMSWLQRMRGFTLDVLNPRSRDLVARIWSDILDAFSSPVVNICGDEPWDLGRGKNADRLDAHTRGEAYLEHIVWTHDLCAARGRRTQLWSDVVRNYPHLLSHLPSGLTVLHWGYDDRADYAGTAVFTGAGLNAMVCPGTSGWKRIVNAMDLAERNITTFAQAGRKHGAAGLVNTDWGDFGHFNALACSWHGIAMGAAAAWNAAESGGPTFDSRFAKLMDIPLEAVGLLRRASSIAEHFDTWRLMGLPNAELRAERRLPDAADCGLACEAARAARTILDNLNSRDAEVGCDHRELAIACEFTESFCERLIRLHQSTVSDPPTQNHSAGEWRERLGSALGRYVECWNARNKPLRLSDITERCSALAALS